MARNPKQDMGTLPSKTLAKTGKRPEELSAEERESMMPAKSSKAASGIPSYAAQSVDAATEAKKAFINECAQRGTLFPASEAVWSDIPALQQACSEYIIFCYNNHVSMSVSNLSLWLGIHKETFLRVLRNGDIDPRFDTFSKIREIINYSAEQDITTYEGNPSGKIFFAKSRLGWQEAAQQVDINFGTVQSNQTHPDSLVSAQDLIDITPEIE